MNKFTVLVEERDAIFFGRCLEVPDAEGEGATVEECCERVCDAIVRVLDIHAPKTMKVLLRKIHRKLWITPSAN